MDPPNSDVAKRWKSPYFRRYPWATNVIRDVVDLRLVALPSSVFGSFLDQLMTFDNVLVGFTDVFSGSVIDYRNVLQLSLSPSGLEAKEKELHMRRSDWPMLLSIVSAYRLVELISAREGISNQPTLHHDAGRTARTSGGLDKLEKLKNWPLVLLDFFTLAKSKTPSAPGVNKPLSRHLLLSKWVVHFKSTAKFSVICHNFFTAATQLSYILFHPFKPMELPQFCTSVDDFMRDSLDAAEDIAAETTFWRKTFASSNEHDERLPLQLALLLSPICLFLPINILTNKYGKEKIAENSLAFGTWRPDVLSATEKAIWSVLFDIAIGKMEPLEFTKELLERIPVSQLSSVPSDIAGWYGAFSKQTADPPLPSPPVAHIAQTPPVAGNSGFLMFRSIVAANIARTPSLSSVGTPPPISPAVTSPPSPSSQTVAIDNEAMVTDDVVKKVPMPCSKPAPTPAPPDEPMDVDNDEEQEQEEEQEPEDENRDEDLDDAEGVDETTTTADNDQQGQKALTKNDEEKLNHQRRSARQLQLANEKDSLQSPAQEIPNPKRPPKPKNKGKRKRASTGGTSKPPTKLQNEGKGKANPSTPTQSGSINDPIDVDAYCVFESATDFFQNSKSDLVPLCTDKSSHRFTTADPITVWDAHLRQHVIFPRAHNAAELVTWVGLIKSATATSVSGVAKHVASPSSSIFHIMDYEDYRGLKPIEAMVILKDKCLVIKNMPWDDMEFDEDGLSTLCAFDAVIDVQDLSQKPSSNGSSRIKKGTLRQMLQSSEAGPRSKALNALSFPFAGPFSDRSCFGPAPYTSCRASWHQTSGTDFKREDPIPTSDVHWGLGATGGTMSLWHIDSDGLATTVDTRIGAKLWIVGSDSQEIFSKSGLLLSKGFDIDSMPLLFRTEAILLTPKTRLVMPPNVVHAVYTPQDTICHGSHFYASSTMQSTLASLVHGFICHTYITNISHPEARSFLRRLLHFYHRGLVLEAPVSSLDRGHLPRLNIAFHGSVNIDEALNFLSTCYLVLCINVLDPRSYMALGQTKDEALTSQQKFVMDQYDVNAIPKVEREDTCIARGLCLEAIDWFRLCFQSTVEGSEGEVDLVSILFVQISRSLLRYKYAAEINQIEAAGGCRLPDLSIQLEAALALDERTWNLWTSTAQGSWMDDELRSKSNVEVQEQRSNKRERAERAGQSVDTGTEVEEGEVSQSGDMRVKIPSFEPNDQLLTLEDGWRQDSFVLKEKQRYSVVRTDRVYRSGDDSREKLMKRGMCSRDLAFQTGAQDRRKREAISMKEHISQAQSSREGSVDLT